jgi:hypothetical protein
MCGQPDPSSCEVTSQAASRLGSGGTARQARVQGGQRPQVVGDAAGGIIHVQQRGGDPLHRAPG